MNQQVWITTVASFVCALLPVSTFANTTCTDFGDRNGDCRVDLIDHAALVDCMTGPGVIADPRCVCFDADSDDDVDLADFRSFQQVYSGDQVVAGCDLTPEPLEPAALHIPPVTSNHETYPTLEYFERGDVPTGVYPFSGEFYLTAVDLRIPGRGFDFVWSRKYRSKQGPTTAMGANWDFGYNIRLEASGDDLILHDGNSRADVYERVQGPTGITWCAKDFFREITQAPNGSFVCTFPQRHEWRFHGFDGSPEAGCISEIVDPNGNALSFGYDANGRLSSIVDTLSRTITIGYDGNNRIASVTDFTGRQVTYAYYNAGDADGGEGDLKSVTSSAVVNTPNGNDFPSGKTTLFTYSTGMPAGELDHNLLTITDSKGQTYLSNTYAQTSSPQDADFDRLMRQVLGATTDITDYVYESVVPDAANGFAVTRCIVNDRNGHVEERLFDKLNRCVSVREYAGQAISSSPTSSSTNRPTNKLRSSDPDFFETLFAYNGDSLPARVVDPEGGVVEYTYAGDEAFLAGPRTKANIMRCTRLSGPRGGDQKAIVNTFEYDVNSNGDTNQATRFVDGRNHDTRLDYDTAGNLARIIHPISSIVDDFEYNSFGQMTAHTCPDNGSGHRRRDERTYYNAGPQAGYLHTSIVDATGEALTTAYEYDTVGNVTRVIDPRGNDELYAVNALNQTVRVSTRKPDPGGSVRYVRDFYYDGNDNLERIEVENRDSYGVLQANAILTTEYDFDILNRCLRMTQEVDAGREIVVEYEYDGEGNLTLTRNGEATASRQPTNTVTRLYDERDLIFRELMAAGDLDQSTTQYDYDGNGNTVRVLQGLESNPRATTMTYDGYDRLLVSTDPAGNVSTSTYDPNGNAVGAVVEGELVDVPGGAGNVRLAESAFVYDALDRLRQANVQHFDPVTQAPIGDGVSTMLYTLSDASQVTSVTDDNGHTTIYSYDSVNRLLAMTDAKSNTVTYAYDDNSNVVSITETEKSDLGLPDEVFVSTFTYDGLDRLTVTTDSSGNSTTNGYDSRDNRVVVEDALGHETRFAYDGLDRLTGSTIDMDGDGADGDGTDIVVEQVWDDSSRVTQQVDDNGNATIVAYDPLNRPATRTYADGTSETYVYDVHHNMVSRVDANDTTFVSAYDESDRLSSNTVSVGPGVSSGTTFETFTYDGLDRLVSAADDDSLVEFTYDSLSNTTSDLRSGQGVLSSYDGVGNRRTCTYPSGQALSYTYDALDRTTAISKGAMTPASYLYVGPRRLAMQQYGNGARTLFRYDGVQGVPNAPNDFGVKCITSIAHTAGSSVIDSRALTWDAVGNKTERRDTRSAGPLTRYAYEYDDACRLVRGLEENGIGIVTRDSNYDLDGVGNRLAITGFGGMTGPYVLDPTDPPADLQVNQYTQTPSDARRYDDNGNLVTVFDPVGTRALEFDCYDRLVASSYSLTGDSVEYAYDVLGRRIRKTLTPFVGPPVETNYYYDGEDVIEEQDANALTTASYIRGVRAANIVCVEKGGQVYYQHADDVGNVMALTDTNGMVIERYEYDDFGAPRFFDAAGSPPQTSLVDNAYLFGGCRFDVETGWYLCGERYMDPANGRYLSRDPKCMWDSGARSGNAVSFADNNPWSGVRGRGGDNGGLRVRFVTKMSYDPGHVTVLKARGGFRGHVTVLKARDDFHGHVTVLKARGAASGTDYNSSRSNNSGIVAPPGGGGHVTVLKARADHHGHVTVLKAHGAASGTDYNSSRSNNSGIVAPSGGSDGHVTVLKARGDFHGHVTVLKARGAAEAADHNSSRSNKTSSIAAPPGGGGGHVTVLKARGSSWQHHGHVTVLKAQEGGGHGEMCGETEHFLNGETACSAEAPVRCPDGSCRVSAEQCLDMSVEALPSTMRDHYGHVTILKAHDSDANARAASGGTCPRCGKKGCGGHGFRGHVTVLK